MTKDFKAKALPDMEALEIDRNNYYGQILHGYYQFDCVVSAGKIRSAKFYIPEGTRFNQPTVFLLIPGGVTPWEFLVTSGWKRMADEKKQHLVLAEPQDGRWGSPDEEIAYLNALNEDVSYRPYFCAFASNFYAAAYADAAEILALQARHYPKSWAGIALFGSCGLSTAEAGELTGKSTRVPGVTYSQVQMPIWIGIPEETEDALRLAEYYRAANHSMETETAFDLPALRLLDETSGHPRMRRVWEPKHGGSADEHWCSRIVYEIRPTEQYAVYAAASAWYEAVCRGVCRYPGNANGALRRYAEIRDRGFVKFSEKVPGGYCADGSDLYNREWWVYVPETAEPSKPLPLVFVFHGAGGSADEIADRSGWSDAARRHGFMIVCPGASRVKKIRNVSDMVTNEMFRSMWNVGPATAECPDDLKFVKFLYRWVLDRYPVDRSRVYVSGQSSGGMMSWNCALCLPDLFAAAAPVSAKTRAVQGKSQPAVDGSVIPLLCSLGLEDRIFGAGFGTGEVKELIEHWHDAFHLKQNWDSYTYNDGGRNCSFREGLFTSYLYRNAQDIPLLRCVEVDTKAHAIWPSECEMIWSEWFSCFAKDPETKTLYYNGTEVKK